MATPPTPSSSSHFHRPGKRKHPPTTDDTDPPLSSIINPLSHPPNLIRQFALAGLAHADENPADLIPDFPHRSLDSAAARRPTSLDAETDADENDNDNEEEDDAAAAKPGPKQHKDRPRDTHYDVLLQSIHRFLDAGDVEKAARAFGLLLQLRPGGKPVDVKWHNLWALGAEILMREGERPATTPPPTTGTLTDDAQPRPFHRWGRAANMPKVKAYLDTLIQQHPYDHKHTRAVCAVDFWVASLGCDVYNAHAEHVLGLERAAEDEALEAFDAFDDVVDPDEPDAEARAAQARDELRLRALRAMRAVTKTMDELMAEPPYSKNAHMLRLRAMAALYVADLLVPVVQVSPSTMHEAQGARQTEQQSARHLLMKIINNGGELDPAATAVLNPGDANAEDTSVYSSLPIRGL